MLKFGGPTKKKKIRRRHRRERKIISTHIWDPLMFQTVNCQNVWTMTVLCMASAKLIIAYLSPQDLCSSNNRKTGFLPQSLLKICAEPVCSGFTDHRKFTETVTSCLLERLETHYETSPLQRTRKVRTGAGASQQTARITELWEAAAFYPFCG